MGWTLGLSDDLSKYNAANIMKIFNFLRMHGKCNQIQWKRSVKMDFGYQEGDLMGPILVILGVSQVSGNAMERSNLVCILLSAVRIVDSKPLGS